MPSVFPRQPSVEHVPDQQRRVSVPGEDQAPVWELLASTTAREILATIGEEPKPASEIAAAVGTSLQNACYHLDRLVDGGLVAPTETWYSEKGREMTVYALRSRELVIRF